MKCLKRIFNHLVGILLTAGTLRQLPYFQWILKRRKAADGSTSQQQSVYAVAVNQLINRHKQLCAAMQQHFKLVSCCIAAPSWYQKPLFTASQSADSCRLCERWRSLQQVKGVSFWCGWGHAQLSCLSLRQNCPTARFKLSAGGKWTNLYGTRRWLRGNVKVVEEI